MKKFYFITNFFEGSVVLYSNFYDGICLDAVLSGSRPPLSRYQSSDRWTVPVSLPVQCHGVQNYQVSFCVIEYHGLQTIDIKLRFNELEYFLIKSGISFSFMNYAISFQCKIIGCLSQKNLSGRLVNKNNLISASKC